MRRILVLLLWMSVMCQARREKESHSLVQAIAVGCIRVYKPLYTFGSQQVSFYYDGLITHKSSEKEQRRARKYFAWYRNMALLCGTIAYAKRTIDMRIRHIQDSFEEKVAAVIVNRLEQPTKYQKAIVAALLKRITYEIAHPTAERNELNRVLSDAVHKKMEAMPDAAWQACTRLLASKARKHWWSRWLVSAETAKD